MKPAVLIFLCGKTDWKRSVKLFISLMYYFLHSFLCVHFLISNKIQVHTVAFTPLKAPGKGTLKHFSEISCNCCLFHLQWCNCLSGLYFCVRFGWYTSLGSKAIAQISLSTFSSKERQRVNGSFHKALEITVEKVYFCW